MTMSPVGKRVSVLLLICLAVLLGPAGQAAPPSMSYTRVTVDHVYLNLVNIDLNDQSLLVTAAVSWDPHEKGKTFRDYLTKSHSLAQVTGTFFDLHSGTPIGDIVVRGRTIYRSGHLGSALVVTPDNVASMVDGAPGPAGWRGYESVLQGGLRLVRHGQYACFPLQQGFHDRYMQRLTSRIVVGILPGNRLILAETGHVLLPKLAALLIKMGCTDAMALDGGGSTGFAYDGKCIMSTKRKLANVLTVVRRSPQEIAQRARLRALQAQQLAATTTAAAPDKSFSLLGITFRWPNFPALWRSIFG